MSSPSVTKPTAEPKLDYTPLDAMLALDKRDKARRREAKAAEAALDAELDYEGTLRFMTLDNMRRHAHDRGLRNTHRWCRADLLSLLANGGNDDEGPLP